MTTIEISQAVANKANGVGNHPDYEMLTLSKPILKSLSKFNTSMNELLNFTAQKDELERSGKINIKTTINDVIESINDQFTDAGTVLTQALQVTHIRFSQEKLKSILLNLISNAITYKSRDRMSIVHISTFLKENHVVLSVIDNGTGIPPDKMDELFTEFSTLHDDDFYFGGNLDSGLILTKKLVEETGGKLEAESEWGKGSAFKVYLNQDRIEGD